VTLNYEKFGLFITYSFTRRNMMLGNMRTTLTALLSASVLSGCGAMWPSIKADKNLHPTSATSSPCITDNYDTARKCALLTIDEISTLLESTGKFDRATAYTALGLATVTGGVLAHNGSDNTLNNFAVLSGGLLGLISIVGTKQQRTILEKGLKEMTCSLRITESLQSSSLSLGVANASFVNQNSSSSIKTISADVKMGALHAANTFSSLTDAGAKALAISARTREAMHLEALTKSYVSNFQALNSAQASIATKLSAAVIDIRASLRSNLADLNESPNDVLKTQNNRIVDMAGELIRKRADLEKKATEQPVGNDVDADAASKASQQFVTNTAAVAAVFRDCTDPAVQREIER
jgi:hypothetical protein